MPKVTHQVLELYAFPFLQAAVLQCQTCSPACSTQKTAAQMQARGGCLVISQQQG